MNFFNKYKIVIMSCILLFLMIGAVLFWNGIIASDKKDEEENNVFDLSDINNVSSVEAKLGEDIKITQGYLLNYVSNKAGIWYMSKAYVSSIKNSGSEAIVTLVNKIDGDIKLMGSISKDKCNVKAGELINFVGTIDLKTGMIEFSKLSVENIDYKNVTIVEFEDLVDNIQKVKNNYFIVIGYMVTDDEKYKLFDSKEEYKNNNGAGTYFLLNWKEPFMYTGNQKVTVKCLIEDTYKLNMCELVE